MVRAVRAVLTSAEYLNLPVYVAQRGASFRFDLIDGPSNRQLGELHPLLDSPPSLDHDTEATISRKLQGVTLSVADSREINPLTDRIALTMIIAGQWEFPLGRYMFSDVTRARYSQGTITAATLVDEMFLVDQPMTAGFNAANQPVDVAIRRLLDGLPIGEIVIDATSQTSSNSWAAGTSRGSVLTELATVGGLFKPWFNHRNELRAIRSFEPGAQVPDIDLDSPARVWRDSIAEADDLLTAPNQFVVVSNNTGGSYSEDGSDKPAPPPVTGVYNVPSSAPHSQAQRGFALPRIVEAQVSTYAAAAIYARTLGQQQDVYRRVELSTPLDPRHDGYQVIRWDGRLWLETGWSMGLTAGGEMRHKLRRAFPPTGEDVIPA